MTKSASQSFTISGNAFISNSFYRQVASENYAAKAIQFAERNGLSSRAVDVLNGIAEGYISPFHPEENEQLIQTIVPTDAYRLATQRFALKSVLRLLRENNGHQKFLLADYGERGTVFYLEPEESTAVITFGVQKEYLGRFMNKEETNSLNPPIPEDENYAIQTPDRPAVVVTFYPMRKDTTPVVRMLKAYCDENGLNRNDFQKTKIGHSDWSLYYKNNGLVVCDRGIGWYANDRTKTLEKNYAPSGELMGFIRS